MPLNDSSMQESDNDQISTLQDYDLDIDIEGELIKILSSLAQEGTNKEEEKNDHYQETSLVEPSIGEVIKEFLKEQLHSHCLIDDNLSQYPTYPNLDSDLDHITAEEEKVEINQTSVEEQSCGHSVIEEHACKRDRETETELVGVIPYLEPKEKQSHDDTIVSELDQEHCNEDPCPDSIDRILQSNP